jgi:hypothetical protein
MTRRPARAAPGLILACMLLAPGCVTQTRPSPPERDRPKVKRPARPGNVEPEQMMLSAGVMQDNDGNGFPDTIPVVIYLFGDSDRYALPIEEEGSFEFILTAPDGDRLGRWVFPEDDSAEAVSDSPAGVCYRFALRMAPGRDRMKAQPASLRAIFTDARTGERVRSQGAATIRVGLG